MAHEFLLRYKSCLGSSLVSTNGCKGIDSLVHLANCIHHILLFSLEIIIGFGPQRVCSCASALVITHGHLKFCVFSAEHSVFTLQSSNLTSKKFNGCTAISDLLGL